MRLLFISRDEFPPTRPDVDVLFVHELTARGLLIDWILVPAAGGARAQMLEWNGGKVWLSAQVKSGPAWNKALNRLRGWRNEWRAIGLMRSGAYDVLQIKDRFLTCLLPWLLVRVLGHKIHFTYWLSYPYHEEYRERAQTAGFPRKLVLGARAIFTEAIIRRIVVPLADRIFVQSDTMKSDLLRLGASERQLTAVPMGIDTHKVPPLPMVEMRPEIIYLGSISRVRHLDFLIRVMGIVLKSRPDAKLKLIGKGELKGDQEFLSAEALRLGIQDSVEFVGQLPQVEAWSLLASATVCVSPVFPSPIFIPSSPTKLTEYMALGKASVANDIPEQKKLLEQSGAGLCVQWNENEFADAILKLLADPQLCREMGCIGAAYVTEHRSYTHIASMVKASYDAVIAGRETVAGHE